MTYVREISGVPETNAHHSSESVQDILLVRKVSSEAMTNILEILLHLFRIMNSAKDLLEGTDTGPDSF